jgi:hypothetical protein
MRAQAAIEYLWIYALVAISIVIGISALFALGLFTFRPVERVASGFTNFRIRYWNLNSSGGFFLGIESMFSTPIRIDSVDLNLKGTTSTASCSPTTISPGENTSCTASFPPQSAGSAFLIYVKISYTNLYTNNQLKEEGAISGVVSE